MRTKQTGRALCYLLPVVLLLMLVNAGNAQRGKSVFVELLGNGLGFSANFDSRFRATANGFGFRAGIGFFPGTIFNAGFATIPIGLNHLAGKGPHHLESGAGVTFLPDGISVFGSDDWKVNGVLFVPSLGYRYAKQDGGFQGRLAFTPWIGSGGAVPMIGLSVGATF